MVQTQAIVSNFLHMNISSQNGKFQFISFYFILQEIISKFQLSSLVMLHVHNFSFQNFVRHHISIAFSLEQFLIRRDTLLMLNKEQHQRAPKNIIQSLFPEPLIQWIAFLRQLFQSRTKITLYFISFSWYCVETWY